MDPRNRQLVFVLLTLLVVGILFVSANTLMIKGQNYRVSRVSCMTPQPGILIADWAYSYGSISEMLNKSDVVAVVHIISGNASMGGRYCQFIFTTYEAEVVSPIKGTYKGSILRILQTGGTIGNVVQEVMDDPMMILNQTYIVFLTYNQDSNTYSTLSGPEGRFVVSNGLVYSLNVLYPERVTTLPWKVSGVPLSEFILHLQ
jgi:hypothetical protein